MVLHRPHMSSTSAWKLSFFATLLASSVFSIGCASAVDAPGEDVADESEEALSGATCGGRGGKACGAGEYCRFAESAQCGRADQSGRCARLPKSCPSARAAVCGCDGVTYRNACVAHSGGVSVSSQGACAPVCDPTVFGKVIAPTLAEVKGFWSRTDVAGVVETTEALSLRSDMTYHLSKVVGPHCVPGGLCPRFATRFYESNGTFELASGRGIQLQPDAAGSPAELAQNFGLQKSCKNAVRLATTESGVDVFLTKQADKCVEDAECASANVGPNVMMCMQGTTPTKACNAETNKCGWACKEAGCPAGQKKCMACGAPPPDGICRAFVCVAASAQCPLFQ